MVYLSTMRTRPKLLITPDALRSRRLLSTLTAEELADKAGVSVATIKNLEAPTARGVNVETLRRISAALDCRPADISVVEEVEEVAS